MRSCFPSRTSAKIWSRTSPWRTRTRVATPSFSRLSFCARRLTPEFGAGCEQPIHIFFEPDEIGVNGGRLRHDVKQE